MAQSISTQARSKSARSSSTRLVAHAAVLASIGSLYAFGCSGPDQEPNRPAPPPLPTGVATGGSGATAAPGSGGTGGSGSENMPGMLNQGGSGGSAALGTGGTATLPPPDGDCQPGAPPFACGGTTAMPTPAPPTGLMVDFSTYVTGTGNWGDNTTQNQLTGGSSFYQGSPDSALSATVEAGALRLQAVVPSQGYTGVVLWLGPCVDASMYGGLDLSMGGALNGATLEFRVQTNENYPVSVASTNKGACPYTSCDSRWTTDCLFANTVFTSAMIPATPTATSLPWSTFTNGKPSVSVSPNQLVGLQLHFQCPADVACVIDFTLGTINFSAPTI